MIDYVIYNVLFYFPNQNFEKKLIWELAKKSEYFKGQI